MVMKQNDEVKGLPLDDTVVFHPVPLTPNSLPMNDVVEFRTGETVVVVTNEQIASSFRIRDLNDFC